MNQETIRWFEQIDSSRALLPKVDNPIMRGAGCFGVVLGVMFAVWPFLVTVFLYWGGGVQTDETKTFDWFHLLPLAFFGVFLFPLAGFLWYRSLLALFGRSEILITEKHLSLIHRWGILRRRHRCRLSRLEGFRVEHPGDESPYGLSPTVGLTFPANRCSLIAKHSGGRSLYLARVFPETLIHELAGTLPEHVQRIAMRAGVQLAGEAGNGVGSSGLGQTLVVENLDPSAMPSRQQFSRQQFSTRPTGSRSNSISDPPPTFPPVGSSNHLLNDFSRSPLGSSLVLETTADGLTIEMPKRGYYGSTTKLGRGCLYLFTFMQLVLSAGLVPALLAGRVNGSPLAGWVIFAVFTMLWIIGISYLFHTMSLSGRITLDRRYLNFSQSSFRGTRATEWQKHEIDSIELGVKEYESEDDLTCDYYVKIAPVPSDDTLWFSHFTKPEIEWMVNCLRVAMAR